MDGAATEMESDIHMNRRTFHRWIYFISLCLIAIFLPSSRYMLTVSEIILAVNWLAEGGFRARFGRLRSDRAAIAFMLIYVLAVVGLIWSEDPGYAFRHDLLHKLPTLFMPLIVATSDLPGKRMTRVILLFFISSVLVVSFIGFFGGLMQPAASFREASPFIPGVYFGLMVLIASFQLPLLAREGADTMLMPGRADAGEGPLPAPDDAVNLSLPAWMITGSRKFFIVSLAVSAWLVFFLFHLRSLSGIVSFAAALILMTTLLAAKSGRILLKVLLPALFIIVTALAVVPMVSIWKQTHAEAPVTFNNLDSLTGRGNPYQHDTLNIIRENGNRVYLHIADGELRE